MQTLLIKSHFHLKVDTLDLNIDELCDRSENPYLEKILSVWKQTNSPLWSHWRNLMKDAAKLGEFELNGIGGRKWFRFGLPTLEDEISVCRSMYTNEVVKLNIQGSQIN